MIVGVQELFPRQDIPPVGDHFVDVHVGLGTAAGLPNRKREMLRKCSGTDLPANSRNQFRPALVQLALALIGHGTGFLQISEGFDHLRRHFFPAHPEIFQAPLGLGTPQGFRRDTHFSHGIPFDAIIHEIFSVIS